MCNRFTKCLCFYIRFGPMYKACNEMLFVVLKQRGIVGVNGVSLLLGSRVFCFPI